MLVKISKYVESSTGHPALRIEFHDQAIQAMTKLFGARWQFTPMLTRGDGHKIAVMLTTPTGAAATYQGKLAAESDAIKKVAILHDFHFKGQSLAKIPNFAPTEVDISGPQISGRGLLIELPDAGQVGDANPQIDLFTARAGQPVMKKVPAAPLRCDLSLRFPDGTKATSKITLLEAAEILGKYINR